MLPSRKVDDVASDGARDDVAFGKLLRRTVPRTAHAAWTPAPGRVDPVTLLEATANGRLPDLLPLRYERMCENAFTFFRGSAVVMAADLAGTPTTGLRVQAVGDAHCANFGGYATPERNVVFDLNDFDETLPGPWEWDVKRLATSVVLAGRDAGLRTRATEDATLASVAAYRLRMAELADMSALDVWYSRIDATSILDDATQPNVRRRRQIVEHAATEPIRTLVDKLTETVDGERRFRDDPPELFHSSETERAGFDIAGILDAYRASLQDDVAHLFSRYRLVDFAIKVVGVGSVGTRCGIALLETGERDPILLQIKEATDSVLAAYLQPSIYANNGERVVRGQRLIQHASDLFLGWATSGKRQFYVRQFKDFKASANLEGVDAASLRSYAQACAYALAAAHARSGNATAIAAYLGKSATFDRAIGAFATTYADRAERDFAHVREALAGNSVTR